MISRLFKSSSSITSAAFVLSIAGLLSRLLGVYRDRLLATTFGAGTALDAYYAAFRIPDFIYNLLVLGALSAGFIPVFAEMMQKSKEKGWRLAASVLYVIGICVVVVCLLIFIFTPWLVPLIAPGFDSASFAQTVMLTRIMLLSPILLGISSVFGGVLQSFKHFLAYSFAPILYNLGIISGIFIWVPQHGLVGLAWGVVLGSAMHLLLQMWVALKLGWKFEFFSFWKQEGLKEILFLMGPRTASLAITQVNVIVITAIASGLVAGSLSIFNLAQNLAYVPVGLFGISFAIAAFPQLSEYVAQKKHGEFITTTNKTILQISFFLAPSLIVFLLLDEQIVRLILGAGEFDWESTLLTAKTLQFFLPAMIAQSFLPLFNRVYYAHKNSRYPLIAAVVGLVINLGLGVWLSKEYGVIGLAVAFGLSGLVQLLMLILGEYTHAKPEREVHIYVELIKIGGASFVMALAMQVMKRQLGPTVNLLTVKGVLIHFLIPAFVGGVVYLILLKLLVSREYDYFASIIKQKSQAIIKPLLPPVIASDEDNLMDS